MVFFRYYRCCFDPVVRRLCCVAQNGDGYTLMRTMSTQYLDYVVSIVMAFVFGTFTRRFVMSIDFFYGLIVSLWDRSKVVSIL